MKIFLIAAFFLTLLTPAIRAGDDSDNRPVSWKLLAPNIASDQKNIWLFPFQKTEKNRWLPALIVTATTAGLVLAADPSEGRYFHDTNSFHSFNKVFTGRATAAGAIAVPVAMYGLGLMRSDSKMKRTAMLAGEAMVDSEVLAVVMKSVDRRLSPGEVTNGNYRDTWFKEKGFKLRGNGSLPSGHTMAAFSVATVVARRYGNHKWIPYMAYGAASLVGFSRMTQSAHYASDVFLGAALAYSISRFAVLR